MQELNFSSLIFGVFNHGESVPSGMCELTFTVQGKGVKEHHLKTRYLKTPGAQTVSSSRVKPRATRQEGNGISGEGRGWG